MENKFFLHEIKRTGETINKGIVVADTYDAALQGYHAYLGAYAYGHEANTDYLTEDIKRDELGRIAPDALPAGMFVAGDVHSNIKMQIATAVGTGCAAAMDAIAYLNKNAQ